MASFGSAKVLRPGGCAIGASDQHLKGLNSLGAKIERLRLGRRRPPRYRSGIRHADGHRYRKSTPRRYPGARHHCATQLRPRTRSYRLVVALCAIDAHIEDAGTLRNHCPGLCRAATLHPPRHILPFRMRDILNHRRLAGNPLTVVGGASVAEHQMALIGKLRAVGVAVDIHGDRITSRETLYRRGSGFANRPL